ncbi:hypothetical protein U0070_024612 [Myodes glareolus]|uniref:Uncharacterized protein n=1 Tax=Myodes glareolus TaxID=447135 RepID=A0AAW0JXB4_MYOGA
MPHQLHVDCGDLDSGPHVSAVNAFASTLSSSLFDHNYLSLVCGNSTNEDASQPTLIRRFCCTLLWFAHHSWHRGQRNSSADLISGSSCLSL